MQMYITGAENQCLAELEQCFFQEGLITLEHR